MKNVKQHQSPAIVGTKGKDSSKEISPEKAGGHKRRDSNMVWEFFCSVKLAVVIILIMVVACILGTVIVQE